MSNEVTREHRRLIQREWGLRPEIHPIASIFAAPLELAVCFAHTHTRLGLPFSFLLPLPPSLKLDLEKGKKKRRRRKKRSEGVPPSHITGGRREGREMGKEGRRRRILCFEPFTGRITSVWSQRFTNFCFIIALFFSFFAFFRH